MGKRNQYNRPGSFKQVPFLKFTNGATFINTLILPSGSGQLAVAANSASAASFPAIVNGSIVELTQSAPAGTMHFADVTLNASESFSVVLANDHIKSSSLGSSIILSEMTTPAISVNGQCRVTLSASSKGQAKFAIVSSTDIFGVGSQIGMRYVIIGGND